MAVSTEAALVLDASATLAWFFEDEKSKSNDRILNAVSRSEILVPPIWELEICNALVVAERQKRTEVSQTRYWIELLQALEYRIEDPSTLSVFDTILPIAREQQLSSYDAGYIALALHRKAILVTRDKPLQKVAKHLGVEILV